MPPLCTCSPLSNVHSPIGTKRHFSAVKNSLRQTGCPPYRTAALAVQQMLKRCVADAGFPKILSPHSFRVMVVTALLSQNVPVEEVQ